MGEILKDNFKIHGEYKDKFGDVLKLGSIQGKYKFSNYPDKEDRIFFIKINDGKEFFITHEQQIDLMISILDNDILPFRLMRNIEKFLNALYELKGKKKAEYRKYNVKLGDFANKKLWNCGGNNGIA